MGFMRSAANKHAMGLIKTRPDIPDQRLMVGSAECLSRMPVVIYKKAVPKEAVPLVDHFNNLSYDDVQKGLLQGSLSYEDFPGHVLYMGQPTEDL